MSKPCAQAAWYAMPTAVIAVTGADRLDLLQRLSTQDLRPLAQGGVRDVLFVTHQGRLVARATILAGRSALYLCSDADGGAALIAWLRRYTIVEDVAYQLLGEQLSQLWLWGEAAAALPAAALQLAPPAAGASTSPLDDGWQAASCLCWPLPAAFGTGLVCTAAPQAAQAIRAALQASIGAPCSAQAWQQRRLAAGMPALHLDYPPQAAPLEYRLGHGAVSWNKGCFVGQEVLSRLDSYNKVARLLMGVEGPSGAALLAAAAPGSLKLSAGAGSIGRITSFAASDDAEGFLALALVKREAAVAGPICIEWAGPQGTEQLPAMLLERPFWQ